MGTPGFLCPGTSEQEEETASCEEELILTSRRNRTAVTEWGWGKHATNSSDVLGHLLVRPYEILNEHDKCRNPEPEESRITRASSE